jgi:hypothetical protein
MPHKSQPFFTKTWRFGGINFRSENPEDSANARLRKINSSAAMIIRMMDVPATRGLPPAKEFIMKSVTFSDIERVPEQARSHFPLGMPQRMAVLLVTMMVGLPALMFAFHVFDPAAPLAYIVLPILAGGLLPMTQMMPGRFEVMTRFDACHMVCTLDDALGRLGYTPAERAPGAVRYRARGGKEIAVTVRAHALEVTGPMPALRALRRQMAA